MGFGLQIYIYVHSMLTPNVALKACLFIALVTANIALKLFNTFMVGFNVTLQVRFQCCLVVTLTTIIGNTFMDSFPMVE